MNRPVNLNFTAWNKPSGIYPRFTSKVCKYLLHILQLESQHYDVLDLNDETTQFFSLRSVPLPQLSRLAERGLIVGDTGENPATITMSTVPTTYQLTREGRLAALYIDHCGDLLTVVEPGVTISGAPTNRNFAAWNRTAGIYPRFNGNMCNNLLRILANESRYYDVLNLHEKTDDAFDLKMFSKPQVSQLIERGLVEPVMDDDVEEFEMWSFPTYYRLTREGRIAALYILHCNNQEYFELLQGAYPVDQMTPYVL